MTTQQWLVFGALAVLTVGLAWQQRSIARLRIALEQERVELADTRPATPAPAAAAPRVTTVWRDAPRPAVADETVRYVEPDADLSDRVAALEQSVAGLHRGADHLMDRGEIPPSETKVVEWRGRAMNSALSVEERLGALRLLARSGQLDDQVVYTATGWLTATTNPNEQRELLERLRGIDNPDLKQVTLDLALSAEDGRVRDRAVSNLRQFSNDPQVETALWQMLASETSQGVQRRIVDALASAPMDEARAARLESDIRNPTTPMRTKTAALRVLQTGDRDVSDVAYALAQDAERTADADTRLQYIAAFDDVNHPEFAPPLVNAVQDEDPGIRLRATDALVDYRNDQNIREWLVYLAENDPDPNVRREASRVYREDGRRGGWGGRR